MIKFETNIVINRSISDVFDYVTNAGNNPQWNSAVVKIEKEKECKNELNCEYRMERIIARKRVENRYRVTEYERNKTLTIKTLSGPTPFTYRYSFEPVGKSTLLQLNGKVKEDGLPFKAESFVAAHAIKSGVNSNLRMLKRILERK
ncbi:MAG: SRPBCC family protein [Candidatus Thorarchaeota archaeon]